MWLVVLRAVGAVMFGLCGGIVTAAGYFAVINSIGMMNRAASVTRTRSKILLFEDIIVLGVMIGTFLSLYEGAFPVTKPVGAVIIALYGLFAGMFIGLLVVCLAENIKAITILVKRVKFTAGLGFVILCMALGKEAGHILYYTILYR
jgi:stage V sporulation protein AB